MTFTDIIPAEWQFKIALTALLILAIIKDHYAGRA